MIDKFLLLLSVIMFTATSFAQTSNAYEKAFQAYTRGDIEEAYSLLNNASTRGANNIPTKILMGKIFLAKNNAKNALKEFEEAKRAGADPNLTVLPTAKANLLLEQFRAITSISDAGLTRVNKVEFLVIKGNAYLNVNDRTNAISYYEKALALDPNNIEVLANIAYYYLFTGNISGIQNTISQLTTIAPRDFRVLHLRGQIAKSYRDFNLAHVYFVQAYEAKPNDTVVKRSLAGSYIQRKEYVNAERIIDQIVAQTPDDPLALLFKGRLAKQEDNLGDVDRIIAKLQQSLMVIPQEIKNQKHELLLLRGLTYYLAENYALAVPELVSYLVKQKDSINAVGILADAYIRLGQNYNALVALEARDEYITENKRVSLVLCNLYLDANKTFKCERLLDTLIDIYGNEASFRFMRMRSLMVRDKYKEAAEIYERDFASIELPTVLLMSIDLYTSYQQYSLALNQADRLIKAQPENLEYRLIKADLLLRSGNIESSKTAVEEIIREGESSIKAEFTLGRIHLLMGQYEKGIAIIESLHNANPSIASVAFLYAQLLMATNNNDKALTVLLNTSALGERSQAMSELLVKLYISNEDFTLALSEINHLLRQHFLVPEYLMVKAEIFVRMRNPEKAINQLNVLFGLWRPYPEKLSVLSEKQIAIEDYKGAIDSIELAIEQAPTTLEYQVQLVRIYLLQNEILKAQALVTELDTRFSQKPLLSIVKGEVAKQQGQLQLAQQFFMEAYRVDNTYALAAVKLYQLALQGVETEEFVSVMTEHLKKYERSYLIRNLVADFYMLDSNYSEAKFHYKILLWVQGLPNRENVLNNLANIELLSQNLDAALGYAERAYKINPRSAAVVNTHAWILAKQEKFGDALALMRKAISLRAFDSDFQYHLAYVLAKMNRKPQAIAALEKAMNNDSRFDNRQEAIDLLASLKAGA
jgi:putative PEP-CTERM system TPR-repeat lipoprotein